MRGYKDNKDNKKKSPTFSSAFTIIELIVVVAIIAILATVAIVGYSSWRQATATAQLKSDLSGAASAMENYRTFNNSYPTSVPSTFTPSTGVTLSGGGSWNGVTYCVTAVNSQFPGLSYHIDSTNSTGAQSGSCMPPCPTGFIPVPGSITYGTADFCVMKYEAKDAGSNVPVSTAAGTPFVSVNQTNAAIYSQNVVGCTGCHLITEAEWLTIAQNVLSVNANWSGSTVGTGCIFRGNVGALDACGYDGADPESGTGRNTKASLTLTNGEVIWDLAGNVWEWTSGTSTTGQPGGAPGTGYNWREWTAVTNPGTLSPNPSPVTTGISGASSWNSGNGIGQIISSADETGLRGFLRGGSWYIGDHAGVLTLHLGDGPGSTATDFGFRVSR